MAAKTKVRRPNKQAPIGKVPATKPSKWFELAEQETRSKHPDWPKVQGLLERADARGDLRATYALGTWYLHGKALPRDLRKAVALLQRAAEGGLADAAYDLAVCYEIGAGVRKDLRQALRHYVRAALLGDAQAAFEVGRCYHWGLGVARDRVIAQVWYEHGLARGAEA